jgi:hypothetical protein
MSRRRGNTERKERSHGQRLEERKPLRPKLVFRAGKWEWAGEPDAVVSEVVR